MARAELLQFFHFFIFFKKTLDFPGQRWYNAQANFVGTLVLCPFLESFIYRYATRNAVIPGPPECGVYLEPEGNGLRRKGELL